MRSLLSKPKYPPLPVMTVSKTEAPASVGQAGAVDANAADANAADANAGSGGGEELAARRKRSGLAYAGRSRSLLETVATSYRGYLGVPSAGRRKSLLGE